MGVEVFTDIFFDLDSVVNVAPRPKYSVDG